MSAFIEVVLNELNRVGGQVDIVIVTLDELCLGFKRKHSIIPGPCLVVVGVDLVTGVTDLVPVCTLLFTWCGQTCQWYTFSDEEDTFFRSEVITLWCNSKEHRLTSRKSVDTFVTYVNTEVNCSRVVLSRYDQVTVTSDKTRRSLNVR